MNELHKLGIDDAFAIVIPRCRERGVSPWMSLRMNDHHYTGDPSRVSPLFFEHPELRTRGGKGLFNYARPEVREHYLKLTGEVLERYDVDGLELDWIRTADNFNIDDIERGREILTDFVRAVRRQAQAAAKRRGHPVQLAVRVPAKPEFAYGLGFDVMAWAREGLVDMIIPSDFWNGFADLPVEDWRAHFGVDARQCRIVPFTGTTYACTKGWMVNVMSRNRAAMRGFAASMLDLRSKTFVDLTHAFESGIPHWSGFPDEKREAIYWYDEGRGTLGRGFFAEQFTHVGQWGTHCDPPAHFVRGKRTIDQIDPKEMILPLVVIDVHEKVAENPDYTLSMEDVRDWEQTHGPVPADAFVAMRTDWSKRWPDPMAMRNEDENGVAHYPGWSLEVLICLFAVCGDVGLS